MADATRLIGAWRHLDAREGFEVATLDAGLHGVRLRGDTAAVEEGHAWSVRYDIAADLRWHTRTAQVRGMSVLGEREVTIAIDAAGRWTVDGTPRPDLDGCLDVDLESSACTNTLPVHRLGLAVGASADAPAVWVRAVDLTVERLEQSYRRLPNDDHDRDVYDYLAPDLDFACEITYDAAGLTVDYPGIAVRAHY